VGSLDIRKTPEWCERCNVGMVSQTVWKLVPLAEREEMKADGWKVHGRGGLCSGCLSKVKHAASRGEHDDAALQDEQV
jgi:hypothetical protein